MSVYLRHWLLPAGMLLTLLVYWPGLYGGYLFDDGPNIVDNADVHVTSLDWRDWRSAAQASPSTDLRRPLAMLSFAANYYFTQLDPFSFKLVNLLLHLLNGLLLWRVLLQVLGFCRRNQSSHLTDSSLHWTATGITCAWLLAPINLSGVLYVVQRMESLAQVFVLAGLWLYLSGRRKMLERQGGAGIFMCACGLLMGSALGILSKESAVLLPVYAVLFELAILGFEARSPEQRRGLWILYGLLLIVPLVITLVRVIPGAVSDAAYAGRPFTLAERLLTECRVLVNYAIWTLLPHPDFLSFYHDDLAVSHGWLDPPTTLGAAAVLAIAALVAIGARKTLPLFTLGISWYFAAHLLTATVIPLELVFEHRNYFASIGLLLAAAALVLALPDSLRLVRAALPLCVLSVFAAVTFLRANAWSNPIRFAYVEAMTHPESPRANYELGRTLTAASGYRPDSKLIDPAMAAFEDAARLPNSGAAPFAAMIVVAGHMHRPIQAAWWQGLIDRLSAEPPSAEAVSALISLSDCQHRGACPKDDASLLRAFLAAVSHPQPSGRLLAAYGAFAANQLGDYTLAEEALESAMNLLPDIVGIRIDLIQTLRLDGKFAQAQQLLNAVDPRGLGRADAERVADLKKIMQLQASESPLQR